ncbi:MAG: PQQ-dependent dehydrogenase, methanol/ethanol family [Gammaproteobacteria bacterium]|nr:PQQ-dependent dehydrogenase, methanol/ethanol family [Gammaproteobacteria bacterium]MBK6581885.1 PQQ-dependent dehydrogenase, methanol/ethanol family [Gammaproteobacteria bacterium]MBK7169409.1 PQQ-dependent dehydrogenase, methanol/ethanol family [Gammaproteobacteria bacterium]MBK7520720.1 PQQ-dependent dehydrogenase, methanol/ethanol family [Gammaproteobacteria bacterium]MBK7728367.1 PQQ-dependent dehydrogenase, methanol/ethanol family [Gammaproteobacteria bacterium]
MKNRTTLLGAILVYTLCACGADSGTETAAATAESSAAASSAAAPQQVADVDGARIVASDSEPFNWMSHGRSYDEQRFSPLAQIDESNVAQLGIDWSFDFPTRRGMEATPIVVDGRMYVTSTWSKVYAFDAASGSMLWHYDPEVPGAWAVHLCCDAVNRGVAVWQGKVFVGTLDGRLEALDAENGKRLWSVQTTPTDKPYSITGAPRVVKGMVIIGNGGAELGVRGFVSAYDAATGALKWRFYTVPGDPAQPFESAAMAKAAETWKGGEWWKFGGGGTVWDSMAYDPELNLLYIGVGNGSPWNQQIRSPGGGDNLYLSSIVALNPDTGEYVWHYQTTPGETWDYTATQHLILADIEIAGVPRKVIMQAPKNGFFYVLDRSTGEFISAEAYAQQSWTTGIDKTTGRPIPVEEARYRGKEAIVFPSPHGAHNWHPMSYSPKTGLVYLPVQEIPFVYKHDDKFKFTPGLWNIGVIAEAAGMPENAAAAAAILKMVEGRLVAWDPVAQKEVWRVEQGVPFNGGVLSTAGNLVFQGSARGEFAAYRATDGVQLWSKPVQTGVVAPPISYAVNGKQYVAVVVGWGGALPLAGGEVAALAGVVNRSRLIVFSLDGKQQLAEPVAEVRELAPPPLEASAEQVAVGKTLFAARCMPCHGDGAVGGGVVPDLRYMSAQTHAEFDAIVLGGLRHEKGMVGFANVSGGEVLGKDEVDAIHAYVTKRAHDAMARQ